MLMEDFYEETGYQEKNKMQRKDGAGKMAGWLMQCRSNAWKCGAASVSVF